MNIKQVIILCAGMGSRMQHLTAEVPKPMVKIDGKTLIEHHLDYLDKNKIYKLVITTFYKSETLERFILSLPISKKFEIYFSKEKELLGTAGGVKNALRFLGKDPFFIINNDSIFADEKPAFKLLELSWKPEIMPMLLLLTRKENSFGYWLNGDFDKNNQGQLNQNNPYREFINPGMYITDYRLFNNYSEEKLEFPTVFKDLIEQQKLYGVVHQGKWFHIGDLEAYNQYNIKSSKR